MLFDRHILPLAIGLAAAFFWHPPGVRAANDAAGLLKTYCTRCHNPAKHQADFDLTALGVKPALGRDFEEAEDRLQGPRVVIIGEGLWRRRFGGDRGLIGREVTLDDRASKLPANDPVARRLRTASAQVDDLRKRIVATKEGGMITGEERLREYLGDLYGGVIFYGGRPTQMQTMRTDALGRELTDVVKDFDAWSAKELPGINSALTNKQLPPIQMLTREDWEKNAPKV